MKKETAEQRMMEILKKLHPEKFQQAVETKAEYEKREGNLRGVSEKEIDTFREIQGITYFLQAPELFSEKFCKKCGRPFLVSRMYIAYCSYDCIRESILEDYGFVWSYHDDLDNAILEVYEGNQPIWITNLDTLKKCLTKILRLTEDQPQNSNECKSESSKNLSQDSTSSSPPTTTTSPSISSIPTTTRSGPIPIPKLR